VRACPPRHKEGETPVEPGHRKKRIKITSTIKITIKNMIEFPLPLGEG